MAVMDTSGFILFGILFSFLHEIGHIVACYALGYQIKNIRLGFINADIFLSFAKLTDKLIIYLSGPLVNLILALAFRLMYIFLNTKLFNILSFQNLCIGVLNLIPISSFDGGQILYLLLSQKFDDLKVKRISDIISLVFTVPILMVGFWVILISKYNFSLFLIACYIISYLVFKEDIF